MMQTYEQTIVLITGGNGGIGFETARNLLLSSADHHVIIGARNPLKGEQALTALKNMPGRRGSVSGVIVNVDDIDSIAKSAEEIGLVYGHIDVLVNNAVVCPTGRDVVANLRQALSTNVLGAVAVTEFYKHLLRRSASPRIVFVNSTLGSITQAASPTSMYYNTNLSEYRVSKAALNMAMVQIAKTYAEEGNGLEKLKVFGAVPGPTHAEPLGPQGTPKGSAGSLATIAVGAIVVADVVKGNHDDQAGRVVGPYGVVEW